MYRDQLLNTYAAIYISPPMGTTVIGYCPKKSKHLTYVISVNHVTYMIIDTIRVFIRWLLTELLVSVLNQV